jgi:hypothetical protein
MITTVAPAWRLLRAKDLAGYHRQPTTLRSAPATGQLHPV